MVGRVGASGAWGQRKEPGGRAEGSLELWGPGSSCCINRQALSWSGEVEFQCPDNTEQRLNGTSAEIKDKSCYRARASTSRVWRQGLDPVT